MANLKQLEILNEGTVVWNEWRSKNATIQPDLSGVDLTQVFRGGSDDLELNLAGANLSDSDLSNTELSEVNLCGAQLHDANLQRAKLKHANLRGAHLTGADLYEADLTEADLSYAFLLAANLNKVTLAGALLVETCLDTAKLSQANLQGANLTNAELSSACLNDANLRGANLGHARLRSATLKSASLVDACLAHAVLTSADLTGADFTRANLSCAKLSARLVSANFQEADLSGAKFEYAEMAGTILGNVDLSVVAGLDRVLHRGPSTIGADTLIRSRGNIAHGFLRGAGLPDDFIDYARSFVKGALEFNSCFISYSTKDQDFAERIYIDLQRHGVRCWFAPYDAQSGRKLHQQIDEAISIHDRLLLILSPDSINSAWVKREISKARKREIEEGRDVLFPIRLVEFPVLREWVYFDSDTCTDHAAEIRAYYIPDFSNWRDGESYQSGIRRLLKDLNKGQRSNVSSDGLSQGATARSQNI